MKPIKLSNEGYVSVIPDPPRLSIDDDLARAPVPCPFQAPCWKYIRSPKARKGYIDEQGIHRKIFIDYICSFSREGDLESCSHYQKFMKEEESRVRDNVDDTDLPAAGAS